MASRSDKSGATGGGAPQRKVAVIESALADELAAMTLEQKELLQRTGAGSVGWVPLAAYRTQIADVVDSHPIPWPCGFATAVGLRPGHSRGSASRSDHTAAWSPSAAAPSHNGLLDLVELDVLHDDLDQPEKPSP